MELFVICTLLFASIALLAYQFSSQKLVEEIRLPSEIKGYTASRVNRFDLKQLLNVSAAFTDLLINKTNMPMENLKKKLLAAGKPMNASQFLTFKFLLMGLFPFIAVAVLHVQPMGVVISLGIGYFIPELWLNKKIKERQGSVLKDLPYIIDLLNICVGAGLDFMMAVNRVIEGYRPCVLVNEFKALIDEIQMGNSRRDALKNLSRRINSPEIVSFVRTLLQADRMGTSIGEALKIQAEEIRISRFQKGEEMALKAPIKLLLPLLLFILPVVLIVVAGPILLQFTRGGMMKF